jgi:hypothetical protein
MASDSGSTQTLASAYNYPAEEIAIALAGLPTLV